MNKPELFLVDFYDANIFVHKPNGVIGFKYDCKVSKNKGFEYHPSTSSVWINCPAHSTLESIYEETEYSKKGKELHYKAESAIRHLISGKTAAIYDDSISTYVGSVVDRFKNGEYSLLGIETFLGFEYNGKSIRGMIDSFLVSDNKLVIMDLKTGLRPVSASNNTQMFCYMLMIKPLLDHIGISVNKVVFEIHQDNQIFSFDTAYDSREYADFKARLDYSTNDKNISFITGDHCTSCYKAKSCPALVKQATSLVSKDMTIDSITPEKYAGLLSAEPIIKKFYKELNKKLESLEESGDLPSNICKINTKKTKFWLDKSLVIEKLGDKAFKEPELISPSDALKAGYDVSDIIGIKQHQKLGVKK